jgi:membrane-anchored protein YejM (alkaline phosphatase superfamily)
MLKKGMNYFMSNKITVKSYLVLALIFIVMFFLTIINFLSSNILLFALFFISSIILCSLLILFKPEKKIKIKYGEKILINIG